MYSTHTHTFILNNKNYLELDKEINIEKINNDNKIYNKKDSNKGLEQTGFCYYFLCFTDKLISFKIKNIKNGGGKM